MEIGEIKKDMEQVTKELLEEANLTRGSGVVLGGSTSEVIGDKIGSSTNMDVGMAIVEVFNNLVKEYDLEPMIQGCEHINRALIVEEDFAIRNNFEIVNVIPKADAGGGFAAAAMEIFEKPVVIEKGFARAGIDIGDSFIGMHIKGVGVVVRSEIKEIGNAHLSMIRTRKKLIGGSRAVHY